MEKLVADELTIEVSRGKTTLNAVWRGKSTSREPGKVLKPFFDRLLVAAKAQGLGLEHRFEQMEHFNSSTIAEVIQLIHGARQQSVPLTLRYDARVRWQALSFDALRRAMQVFASDASSPVLIVGEDAA